MEGRGRWCERRGRERGNRKRVRKRAGGRIGA